MKKLMSAILALLMVLSVASFAGAESEPIKLTWAMGTGDVAPIDNAMVLEELNKMSREAIGVECDIQYFTNDRFSFPSSPARYTTFTIPAPGTTTSISAYRRACSPTSMAKLRSWRPTCTPA